MYIADYIHTFPTSFEFQMSSFSTNPAVLERVRELREAEARKKESERIREQERIAIEQASLAREQERLAFLRRTVETSSIEWEAEILFAVESTPNILEVVRKLQSTPEQVNLFLLASESGKVRDGTKLFANLANLAQGKDYLVHYGQKSCDLVFQDSLNLQGLLEALIHYNLNESHVLDIFTLANERARLRIRVLKKVYDVLQERIKEEDRLEAERIKKEQTARRETWVEAQLVKTNKMVAESLVTSPARHTICHNFTELKSDAEFLIVAYIELKLNHTKERFLRVIRANCSGIQGVDVPLQVPSEWATHYAEGKTPFLTLCPTCGKTPFIHKQASNPPSYVACGEHYKWEAATDKHFKWENFPLPNPASHVIYTAARGHWIPWDPKDPDGAIAARALKDKQIAEAEAEIARLQAKANELRRV